MLSEEQIQHELDIARDMATHPMTAPGKAADARIVDEILSWVLGWSDLYDDAPTRDL